MSGEPEGRKRPFGITYYRRIGRSTTFSTPQARYGSHETATAAAKRVLGGYRVYRVNVWRSDSGKSADRRIVSFHMKEKRRG